MNRSVLGALIATLILTAVPAHAQAPHASVGTPQRGSLVAGYALPPRGVGYHWETNRENPRASYGTEPLVRALVRAAAEVARVHPGSDLAIHDLSFEHGGPIRGHGSHTSGRDVDVAYYAVDANGARVDPTTSVWFDAEGYARGAPRTSALRFDAERTWLFLAALLTDPSIEVQYVFMHPALQRLLLRYAERVAPRGAARARAVLRTPRGRRVDPHADHLHVRIRCPAAHRALGCSDH
jgi:penicillin-insensitive murein endopeptidase